MAVRPDLHLQKDASHADEGRAVEVRQAVPEPRAVPIVDEEAGRRGAVILAQGLEGRVFASGDVVEQVTTTHGLEQREDHRLDEAERGHALGHTQGELQGDDATEGVTDDMKPRRLSDVCDERVDLCREQRLGSQLFAQGRDAVGESIGREAGVGRLQMAPMKPPHRARHGAAVQEQERLVRSPHSGSHSPWSHSIHRSFLLSSGAS